MFRSNAAAATPNHINTKTNNQDSCLNISTNLPKLKISLHFRLNQFDFSDLCNFKFEFWQLVPKYTQLIRALSFIEHALKFLLHALPFLYYTVVCFPPKIQNWFFQLCKSTLNDIRNYLRNKQVVLNLREGSVQSCTPCLIVALSKEAQSLGNFFYLHDKALRIGEYFINMSRNRVLCYFPFNICRW